MLFGGFLAPRNRVWCSFLHFYVSKRTTHRKPHTFLTWHLPDTLLFPWRVYQTFLDKTREVGCISFNTVTISVQVPLKWSSSLQHLSIYLIHSYGCSEVALVLRQKNLQHFPFKFEESSWNLESKRAHEKTISCYLKSIFINDVWILSCHR